MLSSRFERDTASLSARINLKANTASPTFTGTVSGITKDMVGLGNAENTTDLAKVVSTATQTQLDLRVRYTDTAAMLTNRIQRDTISLSNRINAINYAVFGSISSPESGSVKYADTLVMLNNRIRRDTSFLVQKSDTAAMLTNRIARDTVSLSNRINNLTTTLTGTGTGTTGYLRNADTLAMLSSRFERDTASLSARINLKANSYSPTFTGTVSGITQAMVGLGAVDNLSLIHI